MHRFFSPVVFVVAAALAAAAAGALLFVLPQPFVGVDDANIYLAYAQNLASGNGFVYNPGGERVEGFTSLLWLLVCTVAVALWRHPEFVLLALNIVLVAITATACVTFACREISMLLDATVSRSISYTSCALAILAWSFLSPGYVSWNTVSLMESALWGCVLVLGTLSAARGLAARQSGARLPGWELAVFIVAALLTRPEAMLIAAVWVLARLVAIRVVRDKWNGALRACILPAAAYVVTLTALVLFRLLYFGYPLPNTYYAKVSPSLLYNLVEGAKYLISFVFQYSLASLCLAAALLVFLLVARQAGGRMAVGQKTSDVWPIEGLARMFVVAVSLLAVVAASVLAGGDYFQGYRFFQPVWPLLVVPLLAVAARLTAGRHADAQSYFRSPIFWLISAAVVTTIYASNRPRWDRVIRYPDEGWIRHEFAIANSGRQLGRVLNLLGDDRSLPTIGIYKAGGIAVAYDGPVVDLLGLNNVRMGHSEGDRKGVKNHAAFNHAVFFELNPDLVVPRLLPPDRVESVLHGVRSSDSFEYRVLRAIQDSARFRARYVPIVLRLPEAAGVGDSLVILTWSRREVVSRFQARGVEVEEVSVGDVGA